MFVPGDDIDTDRIIPARFLRGTERAGLGGALFADWPADAGGPRLGGRAGSAEVLVAGRNFGCGSSREHAVWALIERGFRAIIALGFSDIFRANALENGLLPIIVEDAHHRLIGACAMDPGATVTIDLESQSLTLPDGTRTVFVIEPFARRCMLDAHDRLDALLAHLPRVIEWEATRPATVPTHALVQAGSP